MSKFSEVFPGCRVVNPSSGYRISEQTEVLQISADSNVSSPLAVGSHERDSFVSAGVSLGYSNVLKILRNRAFPEIISSIVQRVVVFVISKFSALQAKDHSMHGNSPSPSGIEGFRFFIPSSLPIPSGQPVEIHSINYRILIARQWDKAIRFVERLNNRVSIHAVFHWSSSQGLLKFSRYCTIFFAFCSPLLAQVSPTPFVKPQYLSNTGVPLSGGCVFTYIAGTTTPLVSYSDPAGVFPNTDPVVLDSSGRANIFLGTSAYKLVLFSAGGVNCSSGSLIWTEDNIQVSNIALLSLNNVWSGTQTFNGAITANSSATFNSGLSSSGPNVLGGGGSLAGTWSGNPTYSGTPNFSNGFTATTGSFSGQITSTLATGTSPFVVASQTKVVNLNVDQVDGCDFAIPCPIGSTTPNTAIFTTLQANTSLKVNGSPVFVGASGTGTNIMSGGTVAGGAGTGVCLDANNAITTSGCTSTHQVFTGANNSICTTGASTYSTCDNTITFSGTFASSAYRASCSGVGPSDARAAMQGIISRTTNTLVYRIVTEGSVAITYNSIECTGTL